MAPRIMRLGRAVLVAIALALSACGLEVTPLSPSTPTAAPLLGTLRVPFANRVMEVTIVGEPMIVGAWRAATERDGEAIAWAAGADIAIGGLSDRDLVLGWIGTVCDVQATLTVAPGRLVVTPAPGRDCDAMAVWRGVVLTFAEPTDPRAITVDLRD